METKDILHDLREKSGLTQEQLAEKLYVTRQAVSRWENGETTPNPETLKQLSRLFGVSINTLLGAPRQLYCYRCGMPLTDDILSHEPDGTPNEDYCQWCYADGRFPQQTLEELTEYLAQSLATPQYPADQLRAWYREQLPRLPFWQAQAAQK